MIFKTEEKTKCDVKDCKNLASYYMCAKGRVGKFFLCKDCVKKLSDTLSKARTPKSPQNTIKRILDKQKEQL